MASTRKYFWQDPCHLGGILGVRNSQNSHPVPQLPCSWLGKPFIGLPWHCWGAEAVPLPGLAGPLPYCTFVPVLSEVGQ